MAAVAAVAAVPAAAVPAAAKAAGSAELLECNWRQVLTLYSRCHNFDCGALLSHELLPESWGLQDPGQSVQSEGWQLQALHAQSEY